MSKLPAIQFYPGDWLRDNVSGCSLAAQGLWLRMMFLMHDSEKYGYLILNGKVMTQEFIARRCGCSLEEFQKLYAELEDAGIPSTEPDGTIYSRRMVRDENTRQQTRERVRKHRDNASCNDDVTPDVTDLKHRASSSISSSSSTSVNRGKYISTREPQTHPLLPEVIAAGVPMGVPESISEEFYHHFEASGWIDKNGNKIVNWRSKLKSWWMQKQSTTNERRHHETHSIGQPDAKKKAKYSDADIENITDNLCQLFNRSENKLTSEETSLVFSFQMKPDDLFCVKRFYNNSESKLKRTSILTLLQNWQQEVDKARAFEKGNLKV